MKWQALVALLAITACTPRPSEYDGEISPVIADDSLVTVVITNTRGRELSSPHFYLEGIGRLPLGVTEGYTETTLRIDRRWIPSDGCMRAIAHYPLTPDYYSAQFCWQRGQKVFIRLNWGGELLVAWAHA